nr:uncharacterized protein K02A2.6-like [Aegilops tauschii subsp. strangulata]
MKTDNFVWSDPANQVFEDLKRKLAEPPVLAAPIEKEPLLLYVAANSKAVSVAVVVERKEAVWGLDMVGPFKRSIDKKTHLLVAVDKFTKWVEAEPVSNCEVATAIQFVKKLIFRFGYPHSIITDNGTNISKGAMKEFCQREHIRIDVSSVAHPQSNGQAE